MVLSLISGHTLARLPPTRYGRISCASRPLEGTQANVTVMKSGWGVGQQEGNQAGLARLHGPRCIFFVTYCTMAFRVAALLPNVTVHPQDLSLRMQQIKGFKEEFTGGGQFAQDAWLNLGTWGKFLKNLDKLKMVHRHHIAVSWYVAWTEYQKGVLQGYDIQKVLDRELAAEATPTTKKVKVARR